MTRPYGRRDREPAMTRLYTARFSNDIYARIEQVAAANKLTVAEIIRISVEAALDAESPDIDLTPSVVGGGIHTDMLEEV